MNYAALKAEIAGPAYKGLSDAEIAAALNAAVVETVRDIETSEAKNILRLTGEYGAVVLLSRQSAVLGTPEAQAVMLAITVMDTLTNTTRLGTSNPEHWAAMQTMVGGLQAVGVISQASADALLALRVVTQSKAQSLGFGQLNDQEIAAARRFGDG